MDKRKQELFVFARMTPAEYLDDLHQLRLGFELAEMRDLDRRLTGKGWQKGPDSLFDPDLGKKGDA